MAEVVRYRNGTRQSEARSVIVLETTEKVIRVLTADGGALRVIRLPLTEQRHMAPLTYHGKPYPPARAARHFARYAKAFGAKKGVKKILRELRSR